MKTFSLLLTITVLASCSQRKENPIVKLQEEEPLNKNLVIGNPIDYDQVDLIIFPVGASYAPSQTGPAKDNTYELTAGMVSFSNGSYTDNVSNTGRYFKNESGDLVDIRNLIFYNKTTGESHTLLDKTAHISSFSIHREFKNPLIMFHVVHHDTNKDKKFNGQDAQVLYVSHLDGSNLVRVTPEDEHFSEYFFYPEQQMILAKMMKDSDSSKVFESYDETFFRRVELKEPAEGKIILNDLQLNNIKTNL